MWSQVESHADNDRTTIELTANYIPVRWFTHRLTTGLDVGAENNWTLYPRQPLGNLDFLGNNGLGAKNVDRANRSFLTLDYAASAKYGFREALEFTTSFGLQHYRSELSTITATGIDVPGGADHDGHRRDDAQRPRRTTSPTRRSACSCSRRSRGTTASS